MKFSHVLATAAISAGIAIGAQPFMISYDMPISPGEANSLAHLWDVATGHSVSAPLQGQAPPPPIALPK